MTSGAGTPAGPQPENVRSSRQFDVPAERVFDAWVVPAIARRWLFATPTGEITRCEIDAQAGGRMSIVDRREGEDVEHTGVYEEVARPSRLVFRFGVPKYSSQMSRVIIDISPAAGDGSELALTHEGVPAEWRASTAEGWRALLEALSTALAGHR